MLSICLFRFACAAFQRTRGFRVLRVQFSEAELGTRRLLRNAAPLHNPLAPPQKTFFIRLNFYPSEVIPRKLTLPDSP